MNYELGSSNAIELEQRLRQSGAWPENPYLSTKMLRRQLRILKAGDFADQTAYVSIINQKDFEKVRLRYWRDRAPRLCQDKEIFDWTNTELSIEEMKERLSSAGIVWQTIEDDLKKITILAKDKIGKIAAKKERRQKESLKRQKCEQLLGIKYDHLLAKVEKEHGLKIDRMIWNVGSKYKIKIVWNPEERYGTYMASMFSVFGVYNEEDSATAFPSVVNSILMVAPLCQSMLQALQQTGNHLSLVDEKLTVISGYRKRRYFNVFRNSFEETLTENIVTEGEDVNLAAVLLEKVKEAGLSLYAD